MCCMRKAHFVRFDDHTLLKHAILKSYLLEWAMKLLSRRGRQSTICFIDAFAGAGRDGEGRPGSPLLAAEAVLAVREQALLNKLVPHARLRLGLVELSQNSFSQMREAVGALLGENYNVLLRNGDYRALLPELMRFAGSSPTLAFLDPCGVSGLSADAIRTLLRHPRSEVFLLASGIGANRLAGVLGSTSDKHAVALARVQESPLLFDDLQREAVDKAARKKREAEEALDVTSTAAQKHLVAALGSSEAVNALVQASPDDRPALFVRMLSRMMLDCGALHVLSIPMRDASAAYKYTLIYATHADAGLLAMKESVSAALRKDFLSSEMRDRIARDLSVPVNEFVERVAVALPGWSGYWSHELRRTSFRRLLLTHTGLFPFQADEVKRELKARGWWSRRKADGKELIEVPLNA